MEYNQLASSESIKKTVVALKENGIDAMVVKDAAAAKEKVLNLLPEGAEVMTMSSVTLDTIGLTGEINDSGKYDSVRKKPLTAKLGAAPDWVVGSIHAVTMDGKVIIVSNSGSQLPAYASGAAHVIWVVGTQKIVADLDAGMKRIYDYVLPLENKRAMKTYGQGSNVSKILIVNKEIKPGRITLVFVKEKLGF